MRILISGVGGPTSIGIAKSIKLKYPEAYIIGVDASTYAPGLYRKDVFNATYKIPLSSDPNYWSYITDLVNKERIAFAFIVPETEVLIWAKRQKEKSLPCASVIPDYDVATFLFDKFKVSSFLQQDGLAPKTIDIKGLTKNKYKDLGESLGYPYWVRLNKTAGALGAFKVSNQMELENWVKVNRSDADFIASEYLPGRNYACKLLYNQGEIVLAASGERIEYLLANASPTKISGMCARGQLLNRPDLVESGTKAVEMIFESFGKKTHGMFTVDFKENNNSMPLITEINIRHVSFSHAFSLAGANFAVHTIDHILKSKPFISKFHQFEKDIQFIRGVDSSIFIVENEELKQQRI